MSIKVHINQLICHETDNQRLVEVEGNTVGECLKNLEKQFSKLELFDKDGQLLHYYGTYVNGDSTYPDELDKPVKDGDEISLLLMLYGG